ncbi:MAG: molecular chaperone TorD family protein [Coriobacteriales bacterium]|jgi:TorA maturation chaperone TorD|nr:molecular chaperone TorD family protein [Coriobacteriales bacterium]
MGDVREDLLIINRARAHIIGLMHHLFSEPPSEGQLKALFDDTTSEALMLFEGIGHNGFDTALNAFKTLRNSAAKPCPDDLDRDYTRLFVGPGTLLAAPWESVYVSPKRLLFQKSTLEVRADYNAEGFVFAGYPSAPDDHLAAELDFIYQLCLRFEAAAETGDAAECGRLAEVQRSFEERHLLRWIDGFAQQVADANVRPYYPVLSRLLADFITLDQDTLAEIIDAL